MKVCDVIYSFLNSSSRRSTNNIFGSRRRWRRAIYGVQTSEQSDKCQPVFLSKLTTSPYITPFYLSFSLYTCVRVCVLYRQSAEVLAKRGERRQDESFPKTRKFINNVFQQARSTLSFEPRAERAVFMKCT